MVLGTASAPSIANAHGQAKTRSHDDKGWPSRNWGFCLLAIVAGLGVALSLSSASISAALGAVWSRAFFAWWSALMAALGVIAWRKISSLYASGTPGA